MPTPFPSSADLIAVLDSDADLQKKAFACQQLAVAGDPESVPALAKLLADDQLADYARSALEWIAAPAAGAALCQALVKLDGRRLAGVIDSLGVRRELTAVPELCRLAAGAEDDAAAEALAALGKIANPEALAGVRAALQSPVDGRRLAAGHAALAAADGLLKQGDAKAATGVLDAVATAKLPTHVTAAAAALASQAARRRIFDGKSFAAWEGDLKWFRIAEGAVVAGSMTQPIPQNEFLCSIGQYGDFELRLKVRLVNGKGNGGIQFRSMRVANSREMAGYQADMAAEYWGGLYDESRRNTFLGKPDPAAVAKVLKPADWNDYVIRCEGPRVRLWLNGLLTVDFTETDPAVAPTGHLGLQIHSGTPSEAWYKDIEVEELQARH
ncbi:MAG: DUF1080 domain-containing protein [Verrucomicrobia bacterium]|nr:DUF1080 domain-containing protein [Verrucomicrobiota bacterium]